MRLPVTSVLATLSPDHGSVSGICDVTKRRDPRFTVDFAFQVRV